jgi:hypothetical protein
VLVACSDALCKLLNGSPDNHLCLFTAGCTARIVGVLTTLCGVPVDRGGAGAKEGTKEGTKDLHGSKDLGDLNPPDSGEARCHMDDACEALVLVLTVFCRCVTIASFWFHPVTF